MTVEKSEEKNMTLTLDIAPEIEVTLTKKLGGRVWHWMPIYSPLYITNPIEATPKVMGTEVRVKYACPNGPHCRGLVGG